MRILAITSGKGGVGKTTLSTNLGIGLVQTNARTVLFDADLQLANVDVALGIKPEFTLQHVVAEEKTLGEVMCDGPGGLKVVAGGSAISTLMAAGPKRMGTFLQQIDDLASQADFLLFDTSAGLDNRVMTFCKAAHEIVIVTTPDPSSVTDAYATIKVAQKRAPGTPIGVIVNMASSEIEASAVFRTLQEISRKFLGVGLSYLGPVTMNPTVAGCTRKRSAFMVADPNGRAAMEIMAIAVKVRTHAAADRLAS